MNIKRFICFGLTTIILSSVMAYSFGCKPDEPESSGGSSSGSSNGEQIIEETGTVFTENGTSAYKIVIPEDASSDITYSANELKKYVLNATSATLPIETDENYSFNKDDTVISLGDTTIFRESGMDVSDREELNRDGFKIYLFGNSVVINGYRDIGVVYGVYEFLENMIGLRAYTTEEVAYTTSTSKIYMKAFALVEAPDFTFRDIDGPLNTSSLGPQTAKLLRANSPSTSTPHAAETFYQLIPRTTENLQNHSEWFGTASLQFCFNNEGALNKVYESCIDYIQKNPQAEYLHISPCDGGGYCDCNLCADEISKYGYSGHLIIMVNKIIERVEAWLKENDPSRDLQYVTMAYTGCLTFGAPVKTIYKESGEPQLTERGTQAVEVIDKKCRPHEKLYIQITPLDYCFSHAWNDTKCTVNRGYYNTVDAWRQITDRLFTYDYGINFTNYFMFFDNYSAIKENLVYYQEVGIKGVFRQAATGASWFPFCELQNYLFGRLTWDTNQDLNVLIEDFIDNYYKDAAPYIKQYFYFMRAHIRSVDRNNAVDENYVLHYKAYRITNLESAANFTNQVLDYCYGLFEQAKAACDVSTTDGKVALERVEKEMMGLDYLNLQFYEENHLNYDPNEFMNKILSFERATSRFTVAYWRERKDVSVLIDELKAKVA